MKGKKQKVDEQEETRNWARQDDICNVRFDRPGAIYSHFKRYHGGQGFICVICKVGVANGKSSEHGVGLCVKLPTIKKKKETKKEKKAKKEEKKQVHGYV